MAKIEINLKSAAETLGNRSTKGTVMLILDDTITGLHTYNRSKAVKESYTEANKKIIELANKVVDDDLSVRDLERMIDNSFERKVKIERHVKSVDPNLRDIENNLAERFDTKVKIRDNKIEIKFSNIADLNRILEIIKYNE